MQYVVFTVKIINIRCDNSELGSCIFCRPIIIVKNNFDSRIIWLDSLSLSERQTVQKSVSLLLSYFGFPPELTPSSFSLQRSFPGRPGLPSGSTQIKRQSPLKQSPNSFSMSACRQPCFRCIENQGILLIVCLPKEILKIYFFFS